jgi:hypothetical protein
MNLTWGNWVLLAAGSGVSAGITNQLFTWLREHMQRSFQRDQYIREIEHQRLMLGDQRRHEAILRAEQAHYEARPLLLPHAKNVHDWLYSTWAKLYGGMQNAFPSGGLNGPADALSELGEIAVSHPTVDVRSLARRLDAQMDERYNIIMSSDREGSPSKEELESWIEISTRLIDSINNFSNRDINILMSVPESSD